MKRILIVVLLIFASMIFPSCSPSENEPITLEAVMLNYRAVWTENYEYDTPVLIDSFTKYEKFLADHPEQTLSEEPLTMEFNETYFTDHWVYAYVKSEPSGSNQLSGEKAVLEGSTLKLTMAHFAPEIGTADMAARVCLFGIKNDLLKDVKTVKGEIQEKEKSNY
ncbi:MAG: hypothetical protein HGA49_13040 [Eubacteriaceae bacterium]|nr:hypothetical protein [Eubacteriaceae bacterium]